MQKTAPKKITAKAPTRTAKARTAKARTAKELIPGVPRGAWVILRGYRSGVNYGRIDAVRDGYIVLLDARKIHYWNGAAALPEIAVYGVTDKGGTRVTVRQDSLPVQQSDISELLIMREAGIAWGKAAPEWRA
jgi:hypothetical protein